jgi:hypothetical protein
MLRTRPLVAVLALPLLLAASLPPALAAGLTPEQAAVEQKACLQRAKGSIEKPKRVCTCMVEGLTEALSAADYAALSALLNGGAASPEGEAAHATAKQIVEQCLAG